jgi:hypothetical protein
MDYSFYPELVIGVSSRFKYNISGKNILSTVGVLDFSWLFKVIYEAK